MDGGEEDEVRCGYDLLHVITATGIELIAENECTLPGQVSPHAYYEYLKCRRRKVDTITFRRKRQKERSNSFYYGTRSYVSAGTVIMDLHQPRNALI